MSGLVREEFDPALMASAERASRFSTCVRRQVGAAIFYGEDLISIGYNKMSTEDGACSRGACPRGTRSYDEIPKDSSYTTDTPCHALHAEEWAVLSAIQEGTAPIGLCRILVTHEPCPNCKRFLRGVGLTRVSWPN